MSNDPMKKSEANDAKEPLQVASSGPDGDGLETVQPDVDERSRQRGGRAEAFAR